MRDIMVDLETLGTTPGAVILSIGAVAFGPSGVDSPGFYEVISIEDSLAHYLFQETDTVDWWKKQSPEAQNVLRTAESLSATLLRPALENFNDYVTSFHHPGKKIRMWGNGADFDNALLAVAYKMVGLKPAWEFYNNRCYRTIKNLAPEIKLERVGVYHNALDDAKSQALHHINIAIALLLSWN